MKNKEIRKIQFGGWSKRDYKEIREKIKRRDKKEYGDGVMVAQTPPKRLVGVQIPFTVL